MTDEQFLRIHNTAHGIEFHLIEKPLIIGDRWKYQPDTRSACFAMPEIQFEAIYDEAKPAILADIIHRLEHSMGNFILDASILT